jgi:hypothetical protein
MLHRLEKPLRKFQQPTLVSQILRKKGTMIRLARNLETTNQGKITDLGNSISSRTLIQTKYSICFSVEDFLNLIIEGIMLREEENKNIITTNRGGEGIRKKILLSEFSSNNLLPFSSSLSFLSSPASVKEEVAEDFLSIMSTTIGILFNKATNSHIN